MEIEKPLTEQKCIPCEGGTAPIVPADAKALLERLQGWTLANDALSISKNYIFPDFKATMVFVNKIAAIAEEEGHHPDLAVSYGKVKVDLSTHATKGLSMNDFILAAKIDAIGTTA
jgi:4a-hydroxytetrahydrobiopterin dehydratase